MLPNSLVTGLVCHWCTWSCWRNEYWSCSIFNVLTVPCNTHYVLVVLSFSQVMACRGKRVSSGEFEVIDWIFPGVITPDQPIVKLEKNEPRYVAFIAGLSRHTRRSNHHTGCSLIPEPFNDVYVKWFHISSHQSWCNLLPGYLGLKLGCPGIHLNSILKGLSSYLLGNIRYLYNKYI